MTSDLLRALAIVAEPPGPQQQRVLELLGLAPGDAGVYTDVFTFRLYPYASVYLGAEGMLGGEARDRIAGFFRAVGASVPAEPDHLTLLLGAYADLVDRDEAEPGTHWARMRSTLLWEHLLSWLPAYLTAVADLGWEPYRSWALTLLDVLRHEAVASDPPVLLPLHLRTAPALPDPREDGARSFTAGLLAPVRSGMIITSSTLAQASRELDLGLRVAERRYVIRHLFDQDAAATLRWLAKHARRCAAAHSEQRWAASTAEFWEQRARSAATLLDAVAAEAGLVAAAQPG